MKLNLSLVLPLALTCLAAKAFSQVSPYGILADAERAKAKVLFADHYAERVVTVTKADPKNKVPATHGTVPNERISLSVSANLAPDFDFSKEIADATVASLHFGSLHFSSPLGDAVPMDANGPKYSFADGKHNSATFPLTTDQLDAEGNPVMDKAGNTKQKKIGAVKFSWNTRTRVLTVTVSSSDAKSVVTSLGQPLGDIDTASHLLSSNGSAPIPPEPIGLQVDLGSATGQRNVLGEGLTKRSETKFGPDGKGGYAETVPVHSVKVGGKTFAPPAA